MKNTSFSSANRIKEQEVPSTGEAKTLLDGDEEKVTTALRRDERLGTDIEILYRDEYICAVRKSANIHVHNTLLSADTTSLLQIVKKEIGDKVYPAHRLDRPTAGIVLFGLSESVGTALQQSFERREIGKTYLLAVRGHTPESGIIDLPLKKKKNKVEATTTYRLLAKAVFNIPLGAYSEAWFSLVRAAPLTGKRHQIRRHFRDIAHPIIGDTKYGSTPYNTFFRDEIGIDRLMLFAESLTFVHPITQEKMHIATLPDAELRQCWREVLGWEEKIYEYNAEKSPS